MIRRQQSFSNYWLIEYSMFIFIAKEEKDDEVFLRCKFIKFLTDQF